MAIVIKEKVQQNNRLANSRIFSAFQIRKDMLKSNTSNEKNL